MRRGRLAILLGTAALYGAAMLVPRGHAPELHLGTTVRTATQFISFGPDRTGLANMQFYINDGRDRLDHLTLAFHVSDDDLRQVTLRDNGQVVYSTRLDDIVGTLHGDVRYDASHSGSHQISLEAWDGSRNHRTFSVVTEGNRIISVDAPEDSQAPMVTFADKDEAWYERFAGDGYAGKAHVSDKSDHLLGVPLYGFSARAFDEDIRHVALEVNGNRIFERAFEEREYDGRMILEPTEVHFVIAVPRGSGSYSIRVLATDGQGRRTIEERIIEAKPAP